MRVAGNGRSIGIRSRTTLARRKEILADTSRTTEENLQCNQHHIRNSCSHLLIFCYRKSSQPSSRVATFNPDLNKAALASDEQQSEESVKGRGRLRGRQAAPC